MNTIDFYYRMYSFQPKKLVSILGRKNSCPRKIVYNVDASRSIFNDFETRNADKTNVLRRLRSEGPNQIREY